MATTFCFSQEFSKLRVSNFLFIFFYPEKFYVLPLSLYLPFFVCKSSLGCMLLRSRQQRPFGKESSNCISLFFSVPSPPPTDQLNFHNPATALLPSPSHLPPPTPAFKPTAPAAVAANRPSRKSDLPKAEDFYAIYQQQKRRNSLSPAPSLSPSSPRAGGGERRSLRQGWKLMSCSHCQELCQQASWLLIGCTRVNN